GLRGLVDAVAERVRERGPSGHREAEEFLRNWEAVLASATSGRRVRESAAAMGLDPYDPEELTDDVIALLEGPFAALAPTLQSDLTESATGPTLPADLGWVRTVLAAVSGPVLEPHADGLMADCGAEAAHVTGYERARWFRGRFRLPHVVDDLR